MIVYKLDCHLVTCNRKNSSNPPSASNIDWPATSFAIDLAEHDEQLASALRGAADLSPGSGYQRYKE